eukprot:CAMPEP_0176476732 /NCGR_PEP_ID=MMETSP0200_2-20121128/219_1 /TAXON_ID=947934 /ORGANISM="Chaetoceros sp., Strain GSL56" /LENGTH=661 /DNA_ID=CAMNT_0017872441 /DNA_START=152 /DNA_END=2137 /DNA_ORIENTATION=+
MNNSNTPRPAIIHGLCFGFIPNDYEAITTGITIPVIALRSIFQLYDSFLDMESASEYSFKPKANTRSQRNINDSLIHEMSFHPHDIRASMGDDLLLVEFSQETTTQSAYVSSECEMTVRRVSNEFEIYLQQHSNSMDEKRILRVMCGGYFVNEFCDSNNGYEQILLLPPLQSEYVFDASTSMADQKKMLYSFITRCVLLQDKCLHGHSSSSVKVSKIDEEDLLYIQLPFVKKPSNDISNVACGPKCIVPTLDDHSEKINDINGEDNNAEPFSNSNDKENWRETLRKATQRRLNEELYLCKKKCDIANIQKYMNVRSRRTLQYISVAGTNIGNNAMPKLDILKMTCSLEPISHGRTSGLEADISMHVDIALSKLSSSSALYNVQLCVSPHSKEHTQLTVETKSAVIPVMRKDDCFTIMSSILVSNIKFEREVNVIDECMQIRLVVSVFFSRTQVNSSHPKPEMNGIILGFLSIPYERFVIHHRKDSSLDSDDTIYIASRPLGDTTESNAIFDYRVPRILLLDISSSCSSNIENDWQSIVESLNACCIPGNRVDFYFDPQQMRVSLSIFGSSDEHRLCLLRQIMKKIPNDARIIGTNTCTLNQEYLATALLENIQVELELMKNLVNSKEVGSRKILNELFMAQSINDDIASIMTEQCHQEAFS